MGRETKILLALLGLLAGVFMGVVSLKLFVPRPPTGTGPDIHAASEPLPLVDPPSLDPPSFNPPSFKPPAVAQEDAYAARSSRFGTPAPVEPPQAELAVVPVSFDHVVAPPPAIEEPPTAPPLFEAPAPTPPAAVPLTAPRGGPAPGGIYVTHDGDSWWSLAEEAYGDGRFYRALYAWNRSLDPRVSLVPGTRLDIPPVAKLGAAWPALLPTD